MRSSRRLTGRRSVVASGTVAAPGSFATGSASATTRTITVTATITLGSSTGAALEAVQTFLPDHHGGT